MMQFPTAFGRPSWILGHRFFGNLPALGSWYPGD